MNALKNKLILLFLTGLGMIQITAAQVAGSSNTLSLQQVVEIVKQYHPVAKQADIFVEKAKADLTISRGMFDPMLQNQSAQKNFNGTGYYNYNRPELSIPTWFGIEVTAGLEYLSGARTDPAETKGESSYIGIAIPLAKNLLMDQRRAALQTAKIYKAASSIEKRNILNNLLLDAMKSYWNWTQQYQLYQIITDAVNVNKKRVAMIKTAFLLGERPAIDTTEALTQLLYYELLQSQGLLEFQNAGLDLSLYLWTSEIQPYDLPETITPADDLQKLQINSTALPELNVLLDATIKNNPELLMYSYKLDILTVDKKLKFQELLPSINFRYNHLATGYDFFKTTSVPLFENNFQYVLSLSVPLRFSQGRGECKKAKLKIGETKLQQDLKLLMVENKVKQYFNELVTLKKQVALQENAYRNFLVLQRGEEIRFSAGESTLFLINARENKALEALQKALELKVKYFKTQLTLQWAAGLLI